ncbi:hypothetical protein SCHPADRAFT_947743 [Schizopora paradoxa]|uniref:Uncharacterized protein n=1 Tax=Schizopora paradoxa TaxID=27342 RepID=A0A0H2QYA5_9AGAM|nr:hypothetical protein SCHPADRAFT_947743 [Schizopora paradoxa]
MAARTASSKAAARLSKKRRHRPRSTLDVQTRQSIAKRAAETRTSIANAIALERARQEKFVFELAKQHNVSINSMRQRVLDVPEGSRVRLRELQQQALAHEEYHKVPPLQLAAMCRELEEFRLMKQSKSSVQRNGRTQDIRYTTSRIDQELKNLRKRAQTSSLCITVNSRADQSGQPKLHVDPISRRFIEIGLGLDINEFSTKFEAFSVSGLCGIPDNDNDRRSLLKSHIRNAVRHGLRQATGLPNLEMAWKFYAADIVRKHRVLLDGWPVNTFNLDSASRAILEKIVRKIEEGTVAWREATSDEDLEEHLKKFSEPEKTRKQRSDKDTRRKKTTSRHLLTPDEVPSDSE